MYSKVKLAGHPLHPILVHFPIAFYAAALAGFAAYSFGADPLWFRLAVYASVAGVVTALVAALPGSIDWIFGIPTGSPAKSVGLAHMLLNVAALLVFAANGWLQWEHRLDASPPVRLPVLLALVGVVLTSVAGYLGGRMMQKHHVGIELTPEQERLEPRSNPRAERRPPPIPHHGPGNA